MDTFLHKQFASRKSLFKSTWMAFETLQTLGKSEGKNTILPESFLPKLCFFSLFPLSVFLPFAAHSNSTLKVMGMSLC